MSGSQSGQPSRHSGVGGPIGEVVGVAGVVGGLGDPGVGELVPGSVHVTPSKQDSPLGQSSAESHLMAHCSSASSRPAPQ